MRRQVVLVLVLLSVCWQALAMGGKLVPVGDRRDVTHSALHWEMRPHHHHPDGSVSQDSSIDSAHHIAMDDGLGSAAILPATVVVLLSVQAQRPDGADEPPAPWPCLDGLRRPPRLTS